MKNFKQKTLNTHVKIALGTGSLLLASCINVANAGNVKGFGEDDLQNNGDPFVERKGVESLSVRVPAANTSVTLSGYVKGDLRYDIGADLGDSFVVSSIPIDGSAGDDRDGHFRAHARQSRLTVRSNTELENGQTLTTTFEGDFFGGGGNETFSNSTGFRLRNAVATYGAWTIGQTWTNFMDFVAYPTTVDFFGPAGKSFARQGQVRYTLDNGLSFSIENPETDGFADLGVDAFGDSLGADRLRESTGGIGLDIAPDFTAAWRGGPGGAGGSYEVSGIVRFLGVQGDLSNGVAVDESETGFGFNIAGGWDFGSLSAAASVTAGDGIGRYIINGAGNDIFVSDTGDIETVTALGASANVKYSWTENSSTLLAVGFFMNDEPDESNGIDNLGTVHLNYLWTPYPHSSFGVEVIQGFIETADGSDGSQTRLAFGAQLNF